MYRKTIIYDRRAKEFAMYINGELCGYAKTYDEAAATLNQLVYKLLARDAQKRKEEAANG